MRMSMRHSNDRLKWTGLEKIQLEKPCAVNTKSRSTPLKLSNTKKTISPKILVLVLGSDRLELKNNHYLTVTVTVTRYPFLQQHATRTFTSFRARPMRIRSCSRSLCLLRNAAGKKTFHHHQSELRSQDYFWNKLLFTISNLQTFSGERKTTNPQMLELKAQAPKNATWVNFPS